MENEVQNSIWVNWSHSCIFWLQSFQTHWQKQYSHCLDISDLDHCDCKVYWGRANKEELSTAECLWFLPCCHQLSNNKKNDKIIPKCYWQMWKWRAFCLCFWPGCLLKVGWDWITMWGALKKTVSVFLEILSQPAWQI